LSAVRPALVFDFGGPVLVTPFELTRATELRLGLPPGCLNWSGPFGTFGTIEDAQWRDVLDGRLTERAYWALRATQFGELTGTPADTRALIAAMYSGDIAELLRTEALALIRDARSTGHPVGILTNDLRAFHSDEWIDGLHLGELVDVVVDGSVEGIVKPDPRIYELTAHRLGVALRDMVFLDDQPVNLVGAMNVGMTAIPVDVTDPCPAFHRARELLGLAQARVP
jgi:putative hydrolase of the HAD superfamily